MRLQKELRQHIDWSFSNQLVELSGSLLAIVIALAVLASFDDYPPPNALTSKRWAEGL